ncbi:LOW QUALITY PROTEIN: polyprotein [Phytophthora palmivora]|uniref:Polyprotein n=1 Tax=Phytophthora palmivora TaxID=4796 RepID=A0A2P4X4T9_9STRA|nr:LOW QUALITY PROTEIN: polyprotein [Phytophthora palmivora]
MNDASRASGISLERASFPHLSTCEALPRRAAVSGEGVIKTLLTVGTEEQHRLTAQELMVHELADLRLRVSTPTSTKKKTDIFCEVDIAIESRQITTELARTRFLLSKLGGKAKEWTLGKLVADASCFPTMESMKADLRLAFEPPQDESIQKSASCRSSRDSCPCSNLSSMRVTSSLV